MIARSDSMVMVAVRPLVVLKYLGRLPLVRAVLATVPLAVSLALGEAQIGLRLGIVVATLLVLSLPLSRLPSTLQLRPGHAPMKLRVLPAVATRDRCTLLVVASSLAGLQITKH